MIQQPVKASDEMQSGNFYQLQTLHQKTGWHSISHCSSRRSVHLCTGSCLHLLLNVVPHLSRGASVHASLVLALHLHRM